MKKLLIGLAITAGVIVLALGGYGLYLYKQLTDTASKVHEPLDRDTRDIDLDKKQPLSFLLLGVDERKNDKGRSDTIVVVTVNPKKKSMIMFNIPRDTRTEIIGRGTEDKINHAYAFGNVPMTIDTVEHFLDIPIDYYVKVNMEAFKDIVDALGGVTVTNSFAFSSDGYDFPEGTIRLNGEKALAYTRMRKKDPKGDLGRNARQQQVIKAIIKEGASIQSITKLSDILNSLEDNVKTNLTFDEMKLIQKNYRSALEKTESFEIKGSGKRINGIYYYIVPEEERKAISERLKEHLEIR
jgi:LCP family protein required for cell wall assembly